ncbi:MAG: fatty acid desaturase [Pseudomonadota bacterium]
MQFRDIRKFTNRYNQKDNKLASISLFGTFFVYFLTLWFALEAMWAWWAVVPLIVVNAFAAVRLYVIQHDCGHWSHFETRTQNNLAGYALSTFTLTPYRAMQRNHNVHHAFLGDLDHRDSTEVHTMTVAEWDAAGFWTKLWYRLYRNPLIMLPIGGFWTFVIRYRWPKNTLKIGPWAVVAHNLAVAVWWAAIWIGYGWNGIALYALTALVSGCIGVFLVYLQHNFEDTYWDHKPDLDYNRATLQGSSALDLGWLWDLGTGNIAYHDIHHFNPGIPLYRLRHCHRALRQDMDIQTIEWPGALRSFTLKLWDEEAERLVPFPKARAARAEPAVPAQ